MDKTLSTILIIFALLLGAVCGAVIAPNEEVIKTVEKIVEIEKQVEVSVEVPSATAYLELAVEDFMKHVDDEELFTCGNHEYDFDEISVNRVYDDYSLDFFNDEEYSIDFSLKLEFDEDDEASCKDKFEVKAKYLEDEIEFEFIIA